MVTAPYDYSHAGADDEPAGYFEDLLAEREAIAAQMSAILERIAAGAALPTDEEDWHHLLRRTRRLDAPIEEAAQDRHQTYLEQLFGGEA